MTCTNKLLRVDLTAGICRPEPLNREWVQAYLGQRGLGSKYLTEEVEPGVDALSPDNVLIIATGPLTGTMASTGGRWSVITKSPLTNAIACSNSGGQFGGELTMAGWDLIIFQGRAPRPLYLHIEDEDAALLDAEDLWGHTVWETEARIKARLDDPLLRIASIGPPGERGCRFACVVNDLHRAAGRSGVGAVMGSKQLKAIAVRGTRGVSVGDPERFMQAVAATNKRLAQSDSRKSLARDGTLAMMDVTNAFGTLPTRNNRGVQFEGADKLDPAAMQTPNANGHVNLITNAACFACTIGCGRICHIDPQHFSVRDKPHYHGASGGLEYETAYALGAAVGVDDIDAATYCGFLCNEYGIDPISLGGTIAAAMELFDIGALSREVTGGLELVFGSAEALCQATELVVRAEGIGGDLALGSRRLCEKYGHPQLSMSVKGQEFAAYDGRAMQGMGLAYATSNRGASHLRASPYAHDFQTHEIDDKPEVVKTSQDFVAAIDSSGLCLFTSSAGMEKADYAVLIDAACEGRWDLGRLLLTGERIWNLERQFNLAAGFSAADDTLPRRILEEPAPSGSAKGQVNRLAEMLPVYYRLRGWNENGIPSAETLARLGLSS